MNEDDFKLTKGFKSYVSKPEITDLAPDFLVKGSKNVLIDFANRIISRNGFTLFGAANTGLGGIKSSYEWSTSTAKQFALRTFDQYWEFYWNSTWNQLMSGLTSPNLEFAKVWDNTEKIDVLIAVNGEANAKKWSGGVAKIRDCPTPGTTLRKQGVLTAVTTIAFVAGTAGTVAATITDSGSNFLNAGFASGDTLYVTGSASNNRIFTVDSVLAGTITLIMSDVLVNEVAGATVTVHNGEPTWAAARFLTVNKTVGTPTISNATPAVVTLNSHGLIVGQEISFSTSGALPTGINVGQVYYIISAGFGANSFEISATFNGVAINTSSGGSGTHTMYANTRQITYLGVNYVYTGGETTDTLTGLTSFPVPALSDPVWQAPITLVNPSAINSNFKQDLVGVQLNQLVFASTKSQEIYGSHVTDYTNFTIPGTRAPGDPFKVNMDNYATCLIKIDNAPQTATSLMIGGGTSEFFKISFYLSQDNLTELVRVIQLKTASGSGLISRGAIAAIKGATAYINREPSLDTIGDIETIDGKSNTPISDLIKDDFDAYNFTGAHVKYWKRGIYIALPSEGIVLIYDLMRKVWQPPQTIPVSRLAVINDLLYGHSSVSNESYQLFVGTNDNGNFINQVARFAYNNGGRRDRIKNMNEYWTDGYITSNGELTMRQYYGFNGSEGYKEMSILGSDSAIVTSPDSTPIGSDPLGNDPLGGASSNPTTSLPGSGTSMLRFWQGDTVHVLDYIEQFVEYVMNTLDGQFAIVAHGSNQYDAGTVPVSHTK